MVKFYKVMWSNQGSECDATWEREDYLRKVIRNSINNGTLIKSRDEIFIRGKGCNTLGVWLLHLHLHFMDMSIIHPFMSLDCMKHAFETLQNMFIFHVCLFYEMNSVQHSSATCATHSWNMSHTLVTWLVSTMQQTHETYETWLWNKSSNSLVFSLFQCMWCLILVW